MLRFILPGLALFALLTLSSAASAQDLKEAAARQKIAAEKLVAEVNRAIERSYKQDATDAKFSLRDVLRQVQASQDLLEAQRTPLVQRLNARIRVVEDAARAKTVIQDTRPGYRDPEKPKYKPPVADPGGGVGSVAKKFTDQGKSISQAQADLIRQRQENIARINLGIEKSAVPTDKEITFPADWKERSERMKKLFGPQMTEKEVKLLKTLNSVMSVDYDADKFKAVINHIRDKTGLTIMIDQASLADANVDYEGDTVSLKVEKASVRTILKKVLADKGLTYIIKEGAIQVMTPKKAAEHTVIRSYQIDDLVSPDPQLAMMFGPFVAQAQMMQNAQMLINLIQQAVEPSYWQPNGPGTIVFYPPTKSLIIRASAEMHYSMGGPGFLGGR